MGVRSVGEKGEKAPTVKIRTGGCGGSGCAVCKAAAEQGPRPVKAILEDINLALKRGASKLDFPDHEVLVHPGRSKIFAACRKAKLKFSLTTSGLGISSNRRLKDLVGQGLTGIRYLLASFNPEVNQLVAGSEPAGNGSVRGLELVHEAGLLKRVDIPVTPFNRGGLDRTILELRTWLGIEPGFSDPGGRFETDIDRAVRRVSIRSGESPQTRPGMILFHPIGDPFPFDPDRCPFRGGDKERRLPARRVLLEHEDGLYTAYDSREKDEDLIVLSKNLRGLISRRTFEGTIRYRRHNSCGVCARFSGCGGCFVKDAEVHRAWAADRTALMPEDLPGFLSEPRAEFKVEGRSTVCVAVDQGISPPLDPGPSWEPWEVADAVDVRGYGAVDYDLDRDPVEGGWSVTFSADSPVMRRKDRGLAVLQLSSACVARCVMCNMPVRFAGKWVRTAEASRLMEELYLLGYRTCDVFGGEITLRPDFIFLMTLAKEIGMRAFFITTGFNLDAAKIERLAIAGVDKCSIALDAVRPELNDAIKNRSGLHRWATRAIRLVLEDGRIPLEVNSVLINRNVYEIEDLHESLRGLGVERHRIFYCIDLFGGMGEPPFLTKEQALDFIKGIYPRLAEKSRGSRTSIDWCPPVKYGKRSPKKDAERLSKGLYTEKSETCYAWEREVFITVEGLIYPCVNPTVFKTEPIGRVGRGKLVDQLGGEDFKRFSDQAGKMDLCQNCISKRTCRLG